MAETSTVRADKSGTDVKTNDRRETYILQRNYLAATRLNLQYYVWQKALGYHLHPSIHIPPSQKSSDTGKFRVVDVATGSALWLIEMAQQHPSVVLDGFDINLSQAPPQVWLPSNASLREWDMTDPDGPPDGCEGQYDVVHLRHVALALEDDALPLMKNLFRLLKPGGWLQWEEANMEIRSLRHASKDAEPGQAITKVAESMAERMRKEWCLQLPEHLNELGGFEECQRLTYQPDLAMLRCETDLILLTWDEVLGMVEGEKKELFIKLVQGLRADVVNGSGLAFGKSVTIARKPSLRS